MHPELHINFLAVLVAVIVNFIIGSLWYGPIFGKAWRKEMNIPLDFKPEQKEVFKAMGIMVIGRFSPPMFVLHYERMEGLFLERGRRPSRLGIRILFRNLYLDRILSSRFSQYGRFRRQILEIFFHRCWLQLNRSSSSCDDSFLLEMIPVFPRICFN